jgi:hypothetical protein
MKNHKRSIRERSNARKNRTQAQQNTGTSRRGEKSRNPATPDLPPNENLRKHADEAYGDTEIPERKP